MIFAFFSSGSGVLDCDWGRKFFRNGDGFFFTVATRLSCKARCTITTKQHNSRFLLLKRIIQNVTAGFALFTVVETRRFYSNVKTFFISKCRTIHISNSLLYFLVHTQVFLHLVDWRGTLMNSCLSGTKFIFF